MKKTDRPFYESKRWFLFVYKVVNEKGRSCNIGSKDYCEVQAQMYNTLFDAGYAAGRYDEFQDAMHEFRKL